MALFKDTAAFAASYPALKSTEWSMLLPCVDLVEMTILRDQVLGATLYNALHAAYQASIAVTPVAMSTELAALHAKCLRPVAFLSAADAIPTLNVLFTSAGAMIEETDKRKAAPMWRTREAIAKATLSGYAFLNELIAFLNTNAADYPTWTEAPVYTEVRESMVPTMKEASRHIRLAGPWLLHKLRPAMRTVQTGPVKSLLGDTDYDALLAAVVADNPSADQVKQLDQIRPAMLHHAIASEATALSLTIDTNGAWNWSGATSGSSISGGEKPATDARLDALIRHHKAKGDAHLSALQALITPATPDAGMPGFASGGTFFMG
jgi:hypothetical protein